MIMLDWRTEVQIRENPNGTSFEYQIWGGTAVNIIQNIIEWTYI